MLPQQPLSAQPHVVVDLAYKLAVPRPSHSGVFSGPAHVYLASERPCAKCSPNGAAVDADVAPCPSYGPTLLVEPGGDHNLSPIRAEAAQSHAPPMRVPGHRGPVDAEPLGWVMTVAPSWYRELGHVIFGQSAGGSPCPRPAFTLEIARLLGAGRRSVQDVQLE